VVSSGGQGREKLSKEQLAAKHQARIDAMKKKKKKHIQVNLQFWLMSVVINFPLGSLYFCNLLSFLKRRKWPYKVIIQSVCVGLHVHIYTFACM
jgi:hypothetical protein